MKTITRRLAIGACTIGAVVGLNLSAWAATLSFSPATQTVGQGDPLAVDIVLSSLNGDYVSAFDMNINYDPSILTFTSYTLTGNLGEISLFEADDWSAGETLAGVINLSEASHPTSPTSPHYRMVSRSPWGPSPLLPAPRGTVV